MEMRSESSMAIKECRKIRVPPLSGIVGQETRTILLAKPAPEQRWWFPLGSITKVGEDAFRWHCVAADTVTNACFIFSGRLFLENDTGILLNEDEDKRFVDEDPSFLWYENLEPFPYCHYFYDHAVEAGPDTLGPWFCIHCEYGSSRELVELKCCTHMEM